MAARSTLGSAAFYRKNGRGYNKYSHRLFLQLNHRSASCCPLTAVEVFCHVTSNCRSHRAAAVRPEPEEVQPGTRRKVDGAAGTAPLARCKLARPGAQKI